MPTPDFNIMDLVNPQMQPPLTNPPPRETMSATPVVQGPPANYGRLDEVQYQKMPTYGEVPPGKYNPPRGQY